MKALLAALLSLLGGARAGHYLMWMPLCSKSVKVI